MLIFVFILNGVFNNVTSEESEFEAQTEDSNNINSQEINGAEIEENGEDTIDEIGSDENIDDTDFDMTSIEATTDGMGTAGMQISAEQIAPIVNQLLGPLSTSIQPYLGPLAPLSSVLSGVISHTVTEVIVNLMNQTIASAKRQEFLQMRNYTSYTSYLVTIPNSGRFLLFTKTPTTHTKPKRRRRNSNGCT